jgi:hypothetical protein
VLFGLLTGNCGLLRLLLGGCGLFGCFLVGLGLLSNRLGGLITPLSGFTIFEPSGFECLF